MSAPDGTEPVADDEILYRRIPVSQKWYDEELGLSPDAFYPRKDETTGISISRRKYKTIEQAAQGKSKKGYYVAVLRASDIREAGIRVVPAPRPDDPGHAELSDLTSHNRLEPVTQRHMVRLTRVVLEVVGPFPPNG